jgi:hypothetical protein
MNTKNKELKQRTTRFGLRILILSDNLPNTFASKIGTVAEEADESLYWLEVIDEGKLVSHQKIASLLKQADELTAIFTSARRSASQPQPSSS